MNILFSETLYHKFSTKLQSINNFSLCLSICFYDSYYRKNRYKATASTMIVQFKNRYCHFTN